MVKKTIYIIVIGHLMGGNKFFLYIKVVTNSIYVCQHDLYWAGEPEPGVFGSLEPDPLEKKQEPEPEPLRKKVRSQSR